MKCRIRITHASFGEVFAPTRDLSDRDVYVKHSQLTELQQAMIVSGQLQDLPMPMPMLKGR